VRDGRPRQARVSRLANGALESVRGSRGCVPRAERVPLPGSREASRVRRSWRLRPRPYRGFAEASVRRRRPRCLRRTTHRSREVSVSGWRTGFKSSWCSAATLKSRHVLRAEIYPCALLIVRAAPQHDSVERMALRAAPGVDMIELDEVARVASATCGRGVRAAPFVAPPHRAADRGGNVPVRRPGLFGARRIRRRCLPELLLSGLFEQDPNCAVQDLPEVAIWNLVSHERSQLLDLLV
jgi:hypothetical protein